MCLFSTCEWAACKSNSVVWPFSLIMRAMPLHDQHERAPCECMPRLLSAFCEQCHKRQMLFQTQFSMNMLSKCALVLYPRLRLAAILDKWDVYVVVSQLRICTNSKFTRSITDRPSMLNYSQFVFALAIPLGKTPELCGDEFCLHVHQAHNNAGNRLMYKNCTNVNKQMSILGCCTLIEHLKHRDRDKWPYILQPCRPDCSRRFLYQCALAS